MMIKYRVREVAKDLGLTNKEVIDTLAKYFPEPKKYMTALEEPELDIVFETFTQERNLESLEEYFAQRDKKPEPAPEPKPRRRSLRGKSPRPLKRGAKGSPSRQSPGRRVRRPLRPSPLLRRRGPRRSRSPSSRCGSRRPPRAGWWTPAPAT